MKDFLTSTKKSFFITFKTIYISITKNIEFEFIKFIVLYPLKLKTM